MIHQTTILHGSQSWEDIESMLKLTGGFDL